MSRYLTIISAFLLSTSALSQILVDQSGNCVANAGNALSVGFFRFTNVESADDFVVPNGQLWQPSRIYAQGSLDLRDRQVRVRVYPDTPCPSGQTCATRVPQLPALCTYTGTADFFAAGIDFNPFNVDLPADFCELGEGRYWLSLSYIDNSCSLLNTCEDWHWDERPGNRDNVPWVIRDPADARRNISCTQFGPAGDCLTAPVETNLCFDIEGSTEDVPAPTAERRLVVKTLLTETPFSASLIPFFSQRTGQNLTFSAPQLPAYMTLQSSGTLLGTADISEVGNDPVFTVFATDSQGRSAQLQVALRIVDANAVDLGNSFAPGVVMRCGSAESGTGTLLSAVDFSTPGDCGDGQISVCDVLPAGASVTEARLSLDLSHPMVSDLRVRLKNPQGTQVTVLDRPGVFDLTPDESSCLESDIRATFSDVAPWPAEQQCESPLALVGPLEPLQSLAGFRNQSATGPLGWELSVENTGGQSAQLQRWCLALQTEPDGLPIYPQLGLPGSTTPTIFSSPTDEVTFSGTLHDDKDVHWYLLEQGLIGVRVVDTQLTPLNGQSVRGYRYGGDKNSEFDPTHAVGNCVVAQSLSFPSYVPAFGKEYYRVQGCPGVINANYELSIVKDLNSGFRGFMILSPARFSGDVRDAVSGELIPLAYVTDGSSTTFSSAVGEYTALVDIGPQTLSIFHPDYLPGNVQAVGIEDETTQVATVNLIPVTYQAVVNQVVFSDGFE